MGQYSKSIAAAIAGALVTLITIMLPAQWKSPEAIAAMQTLITVAIVYFAPANATPA